MVEKELHKFQKRLAAKEVYIEFSENLKKYLTINGYNNEYGGRPLKRLIEKKIGTYIADEIIKNNIDSEKNIIIDIKEDVLTYNVI